jgi:solute carrier family 35 protein F5
LCAPYVSLLLLCLVIGFADIPGASVLIQYIYEDLDFKSPFFLTYMATSLLSFHLPAYFFQKWLLVKYEEWVAAREEAAMLHGGGPASEVGYSSVSSNEDALMINVFSPSEEHPSRAVFGFSSFLPKEHHKIIKAALIISPLWFGANCFYNYSLLLTSVSSSTIISNLSASFTLAFSWYMGLEEASAVKIIGIAICFIGAVSVGLQDEQSGGSDDDSSKGSLGGDVMAIAGSIGYGLYTTAMRWKVGSDERKIGDRLVVGRNHC